MGGVATLLKEGVDININLHPYVILVFVEFCFFHLKQMKKTSTNVKLERQLVKKE